jgi:heme/copper-type cytochrome/quinol oxidase subunit 1
MVTTVGFFVLGGIEALLIRIQLAVPQNVSRPGAWRPVHDTATMIFLVIMPALLGSPIHRAASVGARDMAFPAQRAELLVAAIRRPGAVLQFCRGNPPDSGWFAYAPLTEKPFTLQSSIDYWACCPVITSVGTIATGLNLLVTVVKMRAPGMGWFHLRSSVGCR